ncbi:MAG: hypothetical protein H0W28_13370, partial [Pyrinomonadaceae bacterium]|nr:hypothetical protein [Pyrinomonadaceae bacterium]
MSESTLPGRPAATETTPQSWQQTLGRIAARLSARSMVPVWLMVIFLLSATLRFTGVNWDAGTHRHPDERFLTQVITGVRWPSSFGEYLHGEVSPLNPRNNSYT